MTDIREAKDNDEVARLENANIDLKRANKRYQAALAGANARGEMDSCEVKQSARTLKRYTRVLPRKDPAEIEELAARYDRLAAALEPVVNEEDLDFQLSEIPPPSHTEILPSASVSGDISHKHLLSFAEKWSVISAMERGHSVAAALEITGVKRSQRWARKVRKRFLEEGVSGLQDRRRENGSGPRVLTAEARRRLRALYHERPAAVVSALHRDLCKELAAKGLPEPSYESVQKCLAGYSPIEKAMRDGTRKTFTDTIMARMSIPITQYGNQRWQADSSPLKIWIRVWDEDKWVPCTVWMAAIIDAHTRAIAGFILRPRAINAWDLHALLIQATQPKDVKGWPVYGIPDILQTDQGGDYNSASFVAALGSLAIRHDPDPGNYPQRKGRIERWFRSLNDMCLRSLPGHKRLGKSPGSGEARLKKLITLDQLKSEITRWITEVYHQRVHSETERRPAEYWGECTPLRFVPMEEMPSAVLLKTGINRKVQRTGFRWKIEGVKRVYWSPALQAHVGRIVNIRYNPEALDVVWAFDLDSGELIGEIPRVNVPNSPYTSEFIIRVRQQYLNGVTHRLKQYEKETHPLQKEQEDRKAWDEAREFADELMAEPEAEHEATNEQELEELIRELRRGSDHSGPSLDVQDDG